MCASLSSPLSRDSPRRKKTSIKKKGRRREGRKKQGREGKERGRPLLLL